MKITPLLIVAFSLLLSACSGVKPERDQPDWVNGESAQFPAERYLIGRGSASSAEDAKDRARADLAKVFHVAVAQESRDVQSFERTTEGAGVSRESGELKVTRAVETRTEAVVRGMEIGDFWRDPLTGRQHALAVLSRLQASTGLRREVNDLDAATRKHVERARNEQDALSKVAAAALAVQTQQTRIELQRMLQVMDITGRGVEPTWQLHALQADLDALLQRVKIAPRTRGNDASDIDDALRGALADAGFLAEEGAAADYVLEARLNLDDLGKREGWYWYAGSLDVKLTDTTGRVRGTQQWHIKESATVKNMAWRRAVERAALRLKQELRATLIGFAGG